MTIKEQDWKEKSKKFGLEVVSEGIYTDYITDDTRTYKVEVITVRLTSTALNEWILSGHFNSRDCYETDKGWQAYRALKQAKRTEWENKIIDLLRLNNARGGISITQAQSEIFTVVHIFSDD